MDFLTPRRESERKREKGFFLGRRVRGKYSNFLENGWNSTRKKKVIAQGDDVYRLSPVGSAVSPGLDAVSDIVSAYNPDD